MTAIEDPDLVDLIIADHRDFERMFVELQEGVQPPEYRRRRPAHVIARPILPAVAEERPVHPTAIDKAAGGKDMVEHELEEHSEAEQLMKDLEAVEPTDPAFDRLVGELID